MKKLFLPLLLLCHSLISGLEFCDSSEHFQIYCEGNDCLLSRELLKDLEAFRTELTIDFDHSPTKKMQVNIYPSIAAFHQAQGLNSAPAWLVATCDDQEIDIVSELNPGPYHTEKSVRKILMLNVVKTTIYQKFGLNCAPFWIVFGVASCKVGFNATSSLPEILPTIEQLECVSSQEFGAIGGFQAAYYFVDYLQAHYGWKKILLLLENYDNVEAFGGKSKAALYNEWILSLDKAL